MGVTEERISLPLLVMTDDFQAYKYFASKAGFHSSETKHIKSLHDIQGYKDKNLVILSPVADYQDILDYARAHNIEWRAI